jgi:hypothetical protein
MPRRFETSYSRDPEGGSGAAKWVIGVILGGIASAATGFYLERISSKPQHVAAETGQKAAAPPAGQPPGAQPAAFLPPRPTDHPGPPSAQSPNPVFPPPEPSRPGIPFAKPQTPPPPATNFDELYWSLDEGQGTQALDAKGNVKGLLNGCKWVRGLRGNAIEFDGTSDFLEFDTSPELYLAAKSPFTFACWVKPDSAAGAVFWFTASNKVAVIGVQLVGGKVRGWVRHDGAAFHPSSFGGELIAPTALSLGQWHHVALTRNADGEIELFQDGRSVGRKKGKETGGKITINSASLGRGWYHDIFTRTPQASYLKGCVDEFCVFNRVLTEEEIAKLAGREP